MIQVMTKAQLIETIKDVTKRGWIKSVKKTKTTRNDGAVGNTLEKLLGIPENNLPIANSNGWELKGQRLHTSSLITLKHYEPFPRGADIVTKMLLPLYGWPHKQAGKRYPRNEMSFRSTTSATQFTNRGFTVIVDHNQKKIRFIFDPSKADISDPEIKAWLNSVDSRIGLNSLNPEPYWGFDDLKNVMGEKARNCFYVIADSKLEKSREYFSYKSLLMLSGFSFDKFLNCVERGIIQIDFDARTRHNHGTKFRIKQGYWKELYSEVNEVF
ncbi:MvaI/BcnI restriction endonuclease family protein [bacterium]|nr:MvaI/BcnI restriction endonuclease family protein [bacterium]